MNKKITEWQKILHEISTIKKPEPQRTIMQISGYPHYEKVCSNFLKFFFDTSNEHGLKDLLYRALLRCVFSEEEIDSVSEVKADNEVNCNGKFLDLVIESDQYVIGIENKIWAALYNDLNVYADEIERLAKNKDLKPLLIIMSVRPEKAWAGFKTVTYEDFFSQLKSLVGHYAPTGNNKYLTYLFDFIKTIEDLQGGNMTEPETIAFFKEHSDAIEDLIANYNNYKIQLNTEVISLRDRINIENMIGVNQWIWKKSCLVYDFSYDDGTVAMDTYISPKGWRSVLFHRSGKQYSVFENLIDHLRKELQLDFPVYGDRRLVKEWELNSDLSDISGLLESIIKKTVDYLRDNS